MYVVFNELNIRYGLLIDMFEYEEIPAEIVSNALSVLKKYVEKFQGKVEFIVTTQKFEEALKKLLKLNGLYILIFEWEFISFCTYSIFGR